MSIDIEAFNQLEAKTAVQLLLSCCYCENWAEQVVLQRPYSDYMALTDSCLLNWEQVTEADLLEAFGHHAKIGDVNALKDKFSKASLEQGQILAATDDVIQALYDGNLAYEQQNGFIFIVCASGKSASEMLAILQQRLANDRQIELANAAKEQAQIMTLRLSGKIKR